MEKGGYIEAIKLYAYKTKFISNIPSQENRWPLYSFESNDDYVYDVAWSPTHPALFATVDGTGRLDLWNLNNDTEVSTASVSVDGPAAAFNRVSWTQSGLHVTAGDDAGKKNTS